MRPLSRPGAARKGFEGNSEFLGSRAWRCARTWSCILDWEFGEYAALSVLITGEVLSTRLDTPLVLISDRVFVNLMLRRPIHLGTPPHSSHADYCPPLRRCCGGPFVLMRSIP